MKKRKNNTTKSNQTVYYEQDSDETFYYIAGYTPGGAPFGTTWEEIVEQELKLRPAFKKDAKQAAELIYAAIGDIAVKLTGKTNRDPILDSLAFNFREENNRFSFENVLVADVLDEVAGIVITYPGKEANRLDEPILNRLRKKTNNPDLCFDKEADEGDFYIDTLSVSPKFQGYGIGTALLKEVERLAKQKGFTRISLNVVYGNGYAKKLYEKMGYKEEKIIQINGHDYDYMVKKIEE